MTTSLPPSGVTWKNWQITTNSFDLNPVEKPDMSPFLIHLTGNKEILSILKGESPGHQMKDLLPGYGYLCANIPEGSQNSAFPYKVVCFTESPTFAVDFFRYRSYRRWNSDQRFGIGFSKFELLQQGVRPVIYTDTPNLKAILNLQHSLEAEDLQVPEDVDYRLRDFIDARLPTFARLLFPLGEDLPMGGFMWEREWRYPDENGLVFSHASIRVICCPEEEEEDIREVLAPEALSVKYVRTWAEYDDITEYIREREKIWLQSKGRLEGLSLGLSVKVQALEELQMEYLKTLGRLDDYITYLQRDASQVQEERERINKQLTQLRSQLHATKQQLESQEKPTSKSLAGGNTSSF